MNMNWQEVCDDKSLQDLPYKVELNRFGQIVMSPASNQHGHFRLEIGAEIRSLMPSGKVIVECSVNTGEGTKVADVAWGSADFFKKYGMQTPLDVAPEVCVEIISPSNTPEEMDLKAGLYFEAGALEVWFCDASGTMKFRRGLKWLSKSGLFPDFPSEVG